MCNVVQLLAKPTVVTVIVQPAKCFVIVQHHSSYPYSAVTQPKRAPFAILRFSRDFQAISKPILRRFQANLSVRRIKFKGKQSGLPPVGPTLGNSSLLFTYCCSPGLLFTNVVHLAHCCSVVTVNNKNIVHKLTFGCSTLNSVTPCVCVPVCTHIRT